jgi:hypothetical protein
MPTELLLPAVLTLLSCMHHMCGLACGQLLGWVAEGAACSRSRLGDEVCVGGDCVQLRTRIGVAVQN